MGRAAATTLGTAMAHASRRKSVNDEAILPGVGLFAHLAGWIPATQANILTASVEDEVNLRTTRWNGIWKLPQLAYHYTSKDRAARPIASIEQVVQRIEASFPVTASEVWVNKFVDGRHHIDWHQDQYGEHIFVLSLGATRRVEYRDHRTREPVRTVLLAHGDMYIVHPQFDHRHDHRVPADPLIPDPRISLVIFASSTTASQKP